MFTAFALCISISGTVSSANWAVAIMENLMQAFDTSHLYPWIIAAVILVIIIVAIAILVKHHAESKIIIPPDNGKKDSTGDSELDNIINEAGYAYDAVQGIFYSILYPWQRNVGYCWLYDEASAPFGMIIDCEPIRFEYEGKKWLIEFWKGQYDLTTGCEIGIYTTKGPEIEIPGIFNGTFYECAKDEDCLYMSYSLRKGNKILFTRSDRHWWLTGFKIGEFSEPSQLTMILSITLKDQGMLEAFVEGLIEAGYQEGEIKILGKTVTLKFGKPYSRQPATRIEETDRIIQLKNEKLCEEYQKITGSYDNFPDKVKAVREKAPDMYLDIINIGKSRLLLDRFGKIRKYLI